MSLRYFAQELTKTLMRMPHTHTYPIFAECLTVNCEPKLGIGACQLDLGVWCGRSLEVIWVGGNLVISIALKKLKINKKLTTKKVYDGSIEANLNYIVTDFQESWCFWINTKWSQCIEERLKEHPHHFSKCCAK